MQASLCLSACTFMSLALHFHAHLFLPFPQTWRVINIQQCRAQKNIRASLTLPFLSPLFRTPLSAICVFVCASLTALPAVHGCAIGIKDGELVCARPAEPGTPWVGDCLFTGAGERACVS